ncbi:UDP-glucose/GDP-mannose dehydrogenase family protein [Chitinibacter sp. ZOR0017]|uniref:UDP-glucose dehydrogenase family protein n=1 Tax=Chitinibacter sp. ZOR0017 TaxID=1339254 RepID=UPI0009DDA9FD|nr:UDP-glucose/GDP-mannose dehydrogenase family protein [Chitinibacter sp. ZOR0017]
MRITVIGSGYVGLVTGACLAEYGNEVVCLDLDEAKVAQLQAGGVPIYEPGLDALISRNVAANRLRFTSDIAESVAHGTIQFIAVGTPPDEDGSADLQYVLAAASNIGQHMNEYKVIVNKSTVPVGTADLVREAIQLQLDLRGKRSSFSVVSNPEFLKEGAAIDDFMRPDRIVIGTDDETAKDLMQSIYAPLVRNHDRILAMDIRSAELTKYAANAMLATRISFMNELANLAEVLGADIEWVRKGIGSDPRIGYHFLYPGVGYGGSCFPKDVQALQRTASQHGRTLNILAAVDETNARQKTVLLEKILAHFGPDLRGRHFALWGLAFKPETDDLREAPSMVLIEALLARGATLCAHDPVANDKARELLAGCAGIRFSDLPLDALPQADALIIVTEWKAFRSPDFPAIKAALRTPIIFDGRNLYEPKRLRAEGLSYFPIGREQINLGTFAAPVVLAEPASADQSLVVAD